MSPNDHTWPPRHINPDGLDPLPVPWLSEIPAVIELNPGRQLFVDDYLIESTDLVRRFGRPVVHPASPVLEPQTALELDDGECPMAAPFNDGVWYDPADGLFKAWYMPGWFRSVALAVSEDGLHWIRPPLDVVPGTNLVWPVRKEFYRDGCLVWLDHQADDETTRYKMFQYYRHPSDGDGVNGRGWLHTSPDGIHWSAPQPLQVPVGDNTTIFYNPFRRRWCMSIRRIRPKNYRIRNYREAETFADLADWNPQTDEVFWQRVDRDDRPDPDRPDHRVALYDVNAVAYESLMLGMFAIFRGPENPACQVHGVPKIIDLEVGFSRDGFHFHRPDRSPFLASSRQVGDWNRAYLHAVGGLCNVVGDALRFYFTAFDGRSPTLGPAQRGAHGSAYRMYAGGRMGLATMRRDGFAAMAAENRTGRLSTRPVKACGRHLFINVACKPGRGLLRAAVTDRQDRPLPDMDFDDCVPIETDGTCLVLRWRTLDGLPQAHDEPVKIHFEITEGELYSFWFTDDPDGASYGYAAAGGPGLAGGRDKPAG